MGSALLLIFVIILFVWITKLETRINNCESSLKSALYELRQINKNLKTESCKQVSQPMPVEEEPIPTDTYEDNTTYEDETSEDVIQVEYQKPEEEKEEEITTRTTKHVEYKVTYNEDKNSLESFFLGNAFTIIGALALIISTGIFIKIISSFIVFTPIMKTLIGFIFGTALIAISCNLKDKMKMYSEALMGTGFSVFFITTLCTATLFKTFDDLTCIFIGAIILLLAYFVADKQKTISMITIALIGGYLNICFVAQYIDFSVAFGYLIFLNLLSLVYVYRNPSQSVINILNLIVTLLITASLMITSSNIHPTYPIILWLIYLVYDVIKTNQDSKDDAQLQILSWTNFGILAGFSIILFRDEKLYIGSTLIIAAIVYNLITCYFMMKETEKFKPYLYSLLIILLLAVYFLSEGVLRIAIWSVLGIILAIVVAKLKRDYLANWALMFFGAAATGIFFVDGIASLLPEGYSPIWNNRLLTFSMPLLTTFASYKLLETSKDKNTQKISQIIRLLFLSLVYLFVVFEINNYILADEKLSTWTSIFIRLMTFSIIGFKYTLQTKKIGMETNMYFFEAISYIIGFISLIMLCFGLNYPNKETFVPLVNIRFLAFASAIATSIFFARWTKEEVYKYLAVILGFILLTVEAYDYCDKYLDNAYIVSIYWMLYSGIITTIGILKDKQYLKNVGIITSILTLGKILLLDLSNVDALYKLAIFMIVGIVLMLVSYFYNKHRK